MYLDNSKPTVICTKDIDLTLKKDSIYKKLFNVQKLRSTDQRKSLTATKKFPVKEQKKFLL